MKKLIRFFDKLEDKVRRRLSHYPILYAVVGGIGTVLFWRGVWHTADYFATVYIVNNGKIVSTIGLPSLIDGLISFLVGLVLLLMTGLFVAAFIGNHIIISGMKGEKKIAEKTEIEIRTEGSAVKKIEEEIALLSKRFENIEKKFDEKKQ